MLAWSLVTPSFTTSFATCADAALPSVTAAMSAAAVQVVLMANLPSGVSVLSTLTAPNGGFELDPHATGRLSVDIIAQSGARPQEHSGGSMSSFVTGNMHYIRAPFVANIKPGHRVLILSDFSHDPRVWQTVQATCAELGAETTVALFERRPADYYDPPSAVCEAMMKSDFNVLLASTGMLHCHANFTAMAAGVPAICMDGGMTLEWFQSGAVTDDMKQIAVRKHYVAKRVFGPNARECRVTSRYGTEFSYSVANRITQPPLPH